MDFSSLNNYVQLQQMQGKQSYTSVRTPSQQFAGMLGDVISRNQVIAISANDAANQQAFRKQKDVIEDGKNTRPEEDENETALQTVRKIEKRLIALARLERQMMAGF